MSGEFDFLDKHLAEAGVDVNSTDETDANTDQSEQSADTTPETKTDATVETDKKEPDAKQDSSGGDINGRKQSEQKEEGQKSGGSKDLVLPSGEVVKGGKERRFYEQKQLAEQRLDVANKTNAALQAEISELKTQNASHSAVIQQLNAENPQDVGNALRLFKDLRNNPTETLKKLLAEAVAGGYTIDNITAGIDTSVVKNIVNDAIRSVQTTQQVQQRDFEAEAEQEVNQFFGQFPDARIHEDAISVISAQHPQASLSDIYFRLKEQAIERGLDWSQPLGPQLSTQSQQQQSQQQQQQQQKQPPMLNGRGTLPNNFDERTPLNTPSVSESTEDIIRAAMRDAGIIKN